MYTLSNKLKSLKFKKKTGKSIKTGGFFFNFVKMPPENCYSYIHFYNNNLNINKNNNNNRSIFDGNI